VASGFLDAQNWGCRLLNRHYIDVGATNVGNLDRLRPAFPVGRCVKLQTTMSDNVLGPVTATAVPISGVSLVLGSGGARGYAHIGVIEELLLQGFRIESIAGSSMGALVGGVYAAGKLDQYRNWVGSMQKHDVWRMLDWTLTGGGFIKGDRIMGALRDLVGETSIEDLSIPYTAVAVDIDTQREVWLSRGSLFDAIRASIATPAIFRPYRHRGRTLVDGGLLNPVPVSATLRDLTDCTIAVDVNAPAESLGSDPTDTGAGSLLASHGALRASVDDAEHGVAGQASPEVLDPQDVAAPARPAGRHWKKIGNRLDSLSQRRAHRGDVLEPGLLELFVRSIDTVQATITRFKLAAQPPDLLITIPRNACAFYEFHRAEELIEIGHQRTREALKRWQRPPPRRAR
jgi:NTE family protein